ncbi:MAG: hypothetical protein JWL70_3028 [Acidimicrobiia bacterium]|nr:hypothetical protein [Acidimicrobiia bacterium]
MSWMGCSHDEVELMTAVGVRSDGSWMFGALRPVPGARATVDGRGRIELLDGSAPIDWFVGAADRWHVPSDESSVRQVLLAGAPVVETRVRVAGGDAVQRVYAVADFGGTLVIEIENDSSEPFAVALSRAALLCSRAPSFTPVEGIELPAAVTVVPVAHRTSVRFAISADPALSTSDLSLLASATQVAAGWRQQCEVASRWRVPDPSWEERLVTERSQLLLLGPGDPTDEAVFLLSAEELVRLGESPAPWVEDVAMAAMRLAQSRRGPVDAGLRAAAAVLAAAGEERGSRDADAVRRRVKTSGSAEALADTGVGWIHRRRAQLLIVSDEAIEMVPQWPDDWLGQGVEVYGEQMGPWRVSFAIRWHGERPALLWEIDGPPIDVRCPDLDPTWSTDLPRGEALLAAPARPRAQL